MLLLMVNLLPDKLCTEGNCVYHWDDGTLIGKE